MNTRRLKKILKYGWKDSEKIRQKINCGTVKRLQIFLEILKCFFKYGMWSNQYLESEFYSLTPEKKISVGKKYHEKNILRDDWQKNFEEEQKFLEKYSRLGYEMRDKRIKAYGYRKRVVKAPCFSYGDETAQFL